MSFQEWIRAYLGVIDPIVWGRTSFRILLIFVSFHVLVRFGSMLIDRGIDLTERRISREEEMRRAETLRGLLKSILRYTMNFFALTTILPLVGVPAVQLLAGAGVVGLAVGFGAQNLVRDVISGFFFLYENQFTNGDYIETGNYMGIVEGMGLRVTRVRDFAGQLHFLPNGTISQVTNYSRGPMRALVDIDVAYEEDVDRVIEVLEGLCENMAEELPQVVEGPRVLGVQSFNDSSVTIRVWARTENMQQWGTAREMRRMIKRLFVESDVEIPYPRRVLVPPRFTKIPEDQEAT